MRVETTRVCVVGLGYIGLPTASLLGTKGFQVLGVDVNPDVVSTINAGKIHIVEPDLDILVKSAVNSGYLVASQEPAAADVYILAVPTPFDDANKPDVAYIKAATESIAPHIKPGNIVILESTSPVGTTENTVAKILQDAGHDIDNDIHIAHCPERVLPGHILAELVDNDRIVGGINETATEKAIEFYQLFVRGEVLATDARTAEMAKLSENAFRDVNIAFANELSLICDQLDINVWDLVRLANRHPRVNILRPGPGVGGHCIAVDPWFIVSSAPEQAKLIKTARLVNDAKPNWVVQRVKSSANKFKNPVIGCMGLSFKPDVDDLRESPALEIVKALQKESLGRILVCEPNIDAHKDFDLMPYTQVIAESDIILMLVNHKEFQKIKMSDLHEKIVIDTCGIVS